MSWRKNIFKIDGRYIARKAFTSGPSNFQAGEVLVFESDSYSHYDSSSVFQFRNEGTQELKGWWLHDSEPAESWRIYFEEV